MEIVVIFPVPRL